MKIVHAADVHLDSPLLGLSSYDGAPVSELRTATRRAFDNLIALAVEERAAVLLVAGDLFDGAWKDYSTGLYFAKRLGVLREAGVEVVLLRGNHDAESKLVHGLRLPEGVHLVGANEPETIRLEALGLAIHGQSFARAAETTDLAARYPSAVRGLVNVGLLHTALEGRRGHDRYAPTTVGRMRDKGYDYWALGHVHRREVVSQDPWIVFPGNLQSRQIRESGAKGATLVGIEGGVSSVVHVPLDVLRHAAIDVDVDGMTTSAALDAFAASARAVLAEVADTDRPFRARTAPLLAARVTLRSRRGDPVSDAFVARPDAIRNELRAAAHHAFPDRMWLGEIRHEVTIDDRAGATAPASALVEAIGAARFDAAADAVLARETAELTAKLPSATFADPDADLAGNVELRQKVWDDARDLLLQKLSQREEPDR